MHLNSEVFYLNLYYIIHMHFVLHRIWVCKRYHHYVWWIFFFGYWFSRYAIVWRILNMSKDEHKKNRFIYNTWPIMGYVWPSALCTWIYIGKEICTKSRGLEEKKSISSIVDIASDKPKHKRMQDIIHACVLFSA